MDVKPGDNAKRLPNAAPSRLARQRCGDLMRLSRLFPPLVLVVVLAGCAARDGARDDLGWSIALDGGCGTGTSEASSPVAEGGLIYVGGGDGAVYALDVSSGAQRWRFQTGADLPTDSNLVVVPRGAGIGEQLGAALNADKQRRASGRKLLTATPVLASGSAYIGSWDHRMYALDAANGNLHWAYDAHAPIAAGALVHGDLLLFATHGRLTEPPGRVVALDRRSGREIWSFTESWTRGKLHDRLTLHEGVLYVVSWDAAPYQRGGVETAQTWVRALDATTGRPLWGTKVNDAWPSMPTVTARHVLFMTWPRKDNNAAILRALDRTTGRPLWTHEGRGGAHYWKTRSAAHQSRPPLVYADRVALFASDAYAAGIDLDSGRELWQLSEPFSQKFLNQYHLGPLLYVITGDTTAPSTGEAMGIDVVTGTIKWRRGMPSRNQVMTSIDGAVFIRTSMLGTSLIEIDGRTGEELGTVWRHPLFGNASYTICSGPSRFGDLLLLSTSRMEFAGESPSRGYLYAIKAPRRH